MDHSFSNLVEDVTDDDNDDAQVGALLATIGKCCYISNAHSILDSVTTIYVLGPRCYCGCDG